MRAPLNSVLVLVGPESGVSSIKLNPAGKVLKTVMETISNETRRVNKMLSPAVSTLPTTPANLQTRRICIFAHPRTTSNLFMRLFESHPELGVSGNAFELAHMWGPERLLRRRSPQLSALLALKGGIMLDETFQNSFNRLQRTIADAEAAGKIPFMKEHIVTVADPQVVAANVLHLPHAIPRVIVEKPVIHDDGPPEFTFGPINPTILPPSFLRTLSPVILIRHPAKIIPSYYRASKDTFGATVFDEDFRMHSSLRFSRLLFDWYDAYYHSTANEWIEGERWPVVIDAKDTIYATQHMVDRFAAVAGFSSEHVQYSWAPAAGEYSGPATPNFLKTIRESSGIIRGDSQPVIIEDEAEAWTKEFGKEVSDAMVAYVNAAMPDYEYLLQFRLCADVFK